MIFISNTRFLLHVLVLHQPFNGPRCTLDITHKIFFASVA